MTSTASASPSGPFATPDAGFDYFATDEHYRSLAGRICAALGDGSSFVIVTGGPPGGLHALSQALCEVPDSCHTLVGFSCATDQGRDALLRACRPLAVTPAVTTPQGEKTEAPIPASRLFIVDGVDRLSDEQIEDICTHICTFTSLADRRRVAAVLLTRADFLERLERPPYRLLKDRLAASTDFQYLSRDEITAFIRHQHFSEGEVGTFTEETVAAIADVAGGDPAAVNRLARRLLDFGAPTIAITFPPDAAGPDAAAPTQTAAAAGEPPIADQPPSAPRHLDMATDGGTMHEMSQPFDNRSGKRGQPGPRSAPRSTIPPGHRRRTSRTLLVAALGGILAGGIAAAVLMMNPAAERIAEPDRPAAEASAELHEGAASGGEAAARLPEPGMVTSPTPAPEQSPLAATALAPTEQADAPQTKALQTEAPPASSTIAAPAPAEAAAPAPAAPAESPPTMPTIATPAPAEAAAPAPAAPAESPPTVPAVAAPAPAETAAPVPAAPAESQPTVPAVAAPAPAEAAAPAPAAPAESPPAAPTVATPALAAAATLPPPAAPPPIATPATPPIVPRLSTLEIGALLARGDEFFGNGDVASARLFYERAANAGDGEAALRLGETFDPAFLDRAHLADVRGDLDKAASWYRRARDLGAAGAGILLKSLRAE